MSNKVLLLALALTIAAAAGAALWWLGVRAVDTGRALYAGERPLPGRILGHDADLPAEASRCSNCHGRPEQGPGAAATFAPRLTRDTLQNAHARRGGPPSSYSAGSLCTLLRTGVDPAHVVIPRTMPRYRPSDDDCAALWAYMIAS